MFHAFSFAVVGSGVAALWIKYGRSVDAQFPVVLPRVTAARRQAAELEFANLLAEQNDILEWERAQTVYYCIGMSATGLGCCFARRALHNFTTKTAGAIAFSVVLASTYFWFASATIDSYVKELKDVEKRKLQLYASLLDE